VAAAYWFLALALCGLVRFFMLRGKPAAYRWKWHPLLSALPAAVTIIAILAWFPAPGPAILFASFCICIGVQTVLGSQFCRACGADTRNPMYRYTNWPKCPKCQAVVPQTPPAARRLFLLQFAAMGFLMIAGALSLQAGVLAVTLVSATGLALYLWASATFYRQVQVPMRSAPVTAA